MDAEFDKFFDAVSGGRFEEVRRLYQQQFCDRKNKWGMTALMEAADRGHLPIVKYLVDEGADLEVKDDWSGATSLHWASFFGHSEVVRYLVESGADIAAVNKDGVTALQWAQSRNQKTCTEILEEAAQKKKKIRCAPDDDLAQFQKIFPAEYLEVADAQSGDFFVDVLVKNGSTKILDFIRSQFVTKEEMKQFQEMRKNTKSNNQIRMTHESLLFRAITHGIIGPFEKCYDLSLINSKTLFNGKCALQLAIDYGSRLMTKFIMKGLIDQDDWLQLRFDTESEDGKSIHNSVMKRIEKLEKRFKMGFSRLHIAIMDNRPDVAQYLLNGGTCKVDDGYETIGSAIYHSLERGSDECFDSLLQYSPKLDFVNKFGQNLLHVAIAGDVKEDCCRYLVDQMTELDQVDFMGLAAIHRAVLAENEELCAALAEKTSNWNTAIKVEISILPISQPLIEDLHTAENELAAFPIARPTALKIEASKDLPQKLLSKLTTRENAVTLNIKEFGTVFDCFRSKLTPDDLAFVDGRGSTVVHLVAASLNAKLCENLLSVSIATLNQENDDGNTPLMEVIAILKRSMSPQIPETAVETIRILVQYGSDIGARYKSGCTIFHEALKLRNEEIGLALMQSDLAIALITKDVFMLCVGNGFFTLIEGALPRMKHSHISAILTEDVYRLIFESVPFNTLSKMYMYTKVEVKQQLMDKFLFLAYENGNATFMEQLMNLAVTDWNVLPTGDTILTYLLRKRDVKYCADLLNVKGAKHLVNKLDASHRTAIHVALLEDIPEIILHLLRYTTDINAVDENGDPAIVLLMKKLDQNKKTEETGQIMQLIYSFIEKGATIDRVNERTGKSPICLCIDKAKRSKIEMYNNEIHKATIEPMAVVEASASPSIICGICDTNLKDCVLECGHTLCMTCGGRLSICPFCRAAPANPRKLQF